MKMKGRAPTSGAIEFHEGREAVAF